MYEHFEAMLGEEVTNEMLSYFPARDVEEPVTKEFLKGELALVRLELHDEISGLREDMCTEISKLRTEFGDRLTSELSGQLRWIVGTQIAILAVVVALIIALH